MACPCGRARFFEAACPCGRARSFEIPCPGERARFFEIPCPGERVRSFETACPCGSEVPFGRGRSCFSVTVVGFGNAWGFRCRRVAKRNGGGLSGAECGCGEPLFRSREPWRVRGTGNHCRDERPTTIPFCRKREVLNRESRKNRKGRELPAREVVQNGTWNSPGNCPGGRAAFSI